MVAYGGLRAGMTQHCGASGPSSATFGGARYNPDISLASASPQATTVRLASDTGIFRVNPRQGGGYRGGKALRYPNKNNDLSL